jgi:uncharacterized protein (DUF433 family)
MAITAHPDIMLGKPCIAGTRIPVELLLEDLASGMTLAEIVDQFPQLTEQDLRDAIQFAAEAVQAQHPPMRLVG